MQPSVIITGATGFVGAHVALEFLKAGYNVIGTYRNHSSIQKLQQVFSYHSNNTALYESIKWIEVDLHNVKEVTEAFRDVDFVVHTAAEVTFNNRFKNQLIESNTRMAANVVDAALDAGIKKLCHISSIAALGTAINSDPISEETKFTSVKGQSGYSISKFYSEMEVWRGINLGLNAIILNPSVILGAGDWKTSSSTFIATAAKGMPFYTQGVTGFVDVVDVAKACRVVLESDVSGEQFLLNSENLNYQYLFSCIAEHLGRYSPFIKITPPILRIFASIFMLRSFITQKEPLITFSSARTAWKKSYYSGKRFADRFDFQYTPIEETIRFACKCFKKDKAKV